MTISGTHTALDNNMKKILVAIISFCIGYFIVFNSLGCSGTIIQGPKGDPGQSIVGPTGATGASGNAGSSCTTQNVPGGVLISCSDGSSNVVKNGVDGSPGTQVVPIKFCTNAVDSYPSFAEYGYCLNNQLFAVYWDKTNAFWTLVTPGTYVSTSPQTCTFKVEPNCVVVDL